VLTSHVHYTYDVYNNLIEEQIDPTGGGTYTTTEQFALDVQPKLPVQVLSLSGTIDPSAPADTLLEFVNGNLAERFLSAPSPSGVDTIMAQGAVTSLSEPDVTTWLFANNQGSPTDMVDSSGTLVNHIVYSAFGQDVYESNSSGTHFQGYAGGIADPNTGLIKFGERWYDPATMAWVNSDPAGFMAGGPNLNQYSRNQPTAILDPSGLMGEGPNGEPGSSPKPEPASGPQPAAPRPGRPVPPTFDPHNPATPPGPDWQWDPGGIPGSQPGDKGGSWVRPAFPHKECLHPDLHHPPGKPPHWDGPIDMGISGSTTRLPVDGRRRRAIILTSRSLSSHHLPLRRRTRRQLCPSRLCQ
jgi:RHS repeat-associated protein